MKKYYQIKNTEPSFPINPTFLLTVCYHYKEDYCKTRKITSDIFQNKGICPLCKDYQWELGCELSRIRNHQKERRKKREVHYQELKLACCLNCEHYIHYEFYCKKHKISTKWGGSCDDWEQQTDQGVRRLI